MSMYNTLLYRVEKTLAHGHAQHEYRAKYCTAITSRVVRHDDHHNFMRRAHAKDAADFGLQ